MASRPEILRRLTTPKLMANITSSEVVPPQIVADISNLHLHTGPQKVTGIGPRKNTEIQSLLLYF